MYQDETNRKIHYTTMLCSKREGVVSGDALKTILTDNEFTAVLVDGLGSGEGAHTSAEIVIKQLEDSPNTNLADLLLKSNKGMVGERGAVAAAIRINFERKSIELSSIGNITCYFFQPRNQKVVYPKPMRGYLSGIDQKFQVQEFTYEAGDFFLVHSDGVKVEVVSALLDEDEFMRVQLAQSEYIKMQNDDASFIAGRLF